MVDFRNTYTTNSFILQKGTLLYDYGHTCIFRLIFSRKMKTLLTLIYTL